MSSLIFPTSIIDNFLDQPNKYVDLANSLDYDYDNEGRWPGLRTKNISALYPQMINKIIKQILSLYYDFHLSNEMVSWESSSSFQKINSLYTDGWVHKDYEQLTSILYLCGPGFGTSLCVPKNIETFTDVEHLDKKEESYLNIKDVDKFEKFKLKNNSLFEKTISVDSMFNRLLVFESQNYHVADNFVNTASKDSDRLTLVIFIKNISCSKFPIQRCKRG